MKSGYPDLPKPFDQPKIDAPNPNCLMNTIPEPFLMVSPRNLVYFSFFQGF